VRRGTGRFPRQLEVFDLYERFRDTPALQESFVEMGLMEGTGAPEGRADFPFYLQTMIRLRMRERFRTVAAKWQQYTGRENAQDFREHRVTQINGIFGMAPVNEFGEYDRMRSAEEPGPPFSVGKHGGIYGITYEMVVNDEQDRMLNRIPREIGRTAAEYVSRVVVAFVESNPNYIDSQPFMSTARGNERTTAAAQPTETNLASVVNEMTLKRDPNGIPFTVRPRTIITKSLETALIFRKIKRSQETGVTKEAPTPREFGPGTLNPLADEEAVPGTIIQEPWFNDADDWLVLGDVDDRPAFLVAFLRNQTEPFIGIKDEGVRSAMGGGRDPYTFDFDEIPFKVRHVFGAALGEPMAVYRARPS
jgi:hypothetical protein